MSTPIPRPQSQQDTDTPQPQSQPQSQPQYQIHEQLNDSITWVKDWHSPFIKHQRILEQDSPIKIKSWYKTNINHKNLSDNNLNYFLDLTKFKYFKNVDIDLNSNNSSDNQSQKSEDHHSAENQEFSNAIKLHNNETTL
ncbi:unnamed protein product [Candida verbasci]|uniref:Uncharacterized protein n=1 Tax=Candida verbasci TaxID=1227364 RepID=A0A9W4TSM2_9ASCO|nr:unnamed protein product [Candida verbasci]